PPPPSTLFPYTTLFRSPTAHARQRPGFARAAQRLQVWDRRRLQRRKASRESRRRARISLHEAEGRGGRGLSDHAALFRQSLLFRSEEHTSELQSRSDLV